MKATLLALGVLFSTNVCCATGDSIHYLIPGDTIFLTFNQFNEKIFEHTIEKKQTLFSLATFYGLEMSSVYYYNPELRQGAVSEGYPVKIPIPNKAILRYRPADYSPQTYVPVYYIVRPGDTAYRIAKHHFKMPVEEMLARNGMYDPNIQPGQKLILGWMSIYGISAETREGSNHPLAKRNQALGRQFKGHGARVKEQKGVAYWDNSSRGQTDLYALHATAPLHSVIQVTNPFLGQRVYVKVIGRIPQRAYPKDAIVVLSKTAAQLVGGVDSRFYVNLNHF